MAVGFEVPQMGAPAPFPFAISIEKADREKFAFSYGYEIDRALTARRTAGARGYQWVGDAPTATKVQRVEGGPQVLVKSWEDEIQDLWARYEMVPPDRTLPFDGAANYRTPLTKLMVDAILARIMAGVATIRPIYRVESNDSAADIARAGKIEEFLDYVLEHEVDFVPFLDDALIQAGVEGAAIAFVTWTATQEHRLTEEIEDVTEDVDDGIGGFVSKTTQRSKIVEHDSVVDARPNIDLIPLTDFLVGDPRRKRLKDQPWMGHRSRLYRAEIAQLLGQEGYFDEEIEELLKGAGNQETAPSTQKAAEGQDARAGIRTANDQPQMGMLDTFDIWTLIAWYDWDTDGKPERVVAEIAMPQKRLIRLIKYPYLHNRPFYVPIVPLPRSNFFYPRSLAMDLRMTQDEVDALSNHRTDATSIAISSLFMFLYDEQAGYDPAKTRISLGESIKVDGDINHIQTLAKAFKGVSVPGADVVNQLVEWAKMLMGIHEMQTGGTETKRATAFEIGAVIQEGNVKFRRMIERVAVALAEIAYQIIALYQQHGNRAESKIFKVLNDVDNPFREIEMGELFGRWNYRVHGMAIANQRDLDARKAMDMLKLVEGSAIFRELVGVDPRRRYHLAKTFLDKIGWPVEDVIGKEDQFAMIPPPVPGGGGAPVPPGAEQAAHQLMGGGGGRRPGPGDASAAEGEAGMEAVQEGQGL